MQNGPRPNMNARQRGRGAPFAPRSKRMGSGASRHDLNRHDPNRSQNAEKNYERYLTLARAEALNGNTVGAENYFQHAEHYYRSMSSDPEPT